MKAKYEFRSLPHRNSLAFVKICLQELFQTKGRSLTLTEILKRKKEIHPWVMRKRVLSMYWLTWHILLTMLNQLNLSIQCYEVNIIDAS